MAIRLEIVFLDVIDHLLDKLQVGDISYFYHDAVIIKDVQEVEGVLGQEEEQLLPKATMDQLRIAI